MNNMRTKQTRKETGIALIEKQRRSEHTQGHSDTIEANGSTDTQISRRE